MGRRFPRQVSGFRRLTRLSDRGRFEGVPVPGSQKAIRPVGVAADELLTGGIELEHWTEVQLAGRALEFESARRPVAKASGEVAFEKMLAARQGKTPGSLLPRKMKATCARLPQHVRNDTELVLVSRIEDALNAAIPQLAPRLGHAEPQFAEVRE